MLTGELAYDANYELINDNLLDLTHLSYLHQSTLGRNSMSWGESRPKTARTLRDDAPALALRGIATARLGELHRVWLPCQSRTQH